MRVTREITFAGGRDEVLRQCKYSAPDGTYNLPGGLSMKVETILMDPADAGVEEAIRFPGHWEDRGGPTVERKES